MEERFRKVSSMTTSEIAPPILLRRRLSAPETIMRKHTLAQQRSSSQDSDRSQDSTQSCKWPMDAGSDPNLSKKRDDIRKSTLMKRFWENSKMLPFPRTYSEWQYSFGKAKLTSPHSTPEHLRGSRRSIFESSPLRKRPSPDHHRKDALVKEEKATSYDEQYIVYSSNFSNVTSTESTSRIVESTPSTLSDSSAQVSFEAAPQEPPIVQAYQISTANLNSANLSSLPIKYQFVLHKDADLDVQPKVSEDSGTKTNLNVISNVQLSQSTLSLIFNQVMQDVLSNKPVTPEPPPPAKIINVQNLPSFSLSKEQVESKKIGEINAGSPYKNKEETPLVPRLSALPRSTSMEVNISSNDSFDKESDSGSLVDSLEEPVSPKEGKVNYDEKLVRGELALLPDNSDKPKVVPKKSSVFYIPMKEEDAKAIVEEAQSPGVSSMLPSKLKEKLLKRQLKREEKRKENQNMEMLDSINGNAHQYFNTGSEAVKYRSKKKKTTLPLIENKKEKRAKVRDDTVEAKGGKFVLPRTNRPSSEVSAKRKLYHKTESKQIEILEIMEIVEPERLLQLTPKVKSKIPVLVQQKLPKIPKRPPKPNFLDFDAVESDPKLDQLIANILIDTLNRDSDVDATDRNHNRAAARHLRKFDSIPEERPANTEGNNNAERSKSDDAKMPNGWITFYMLQKNNSPDSTSDEGPNDMATKIPNRHAQGNKYYGRKKRFKQKNCYKDTEYKGDDYYGTDSESQDERLGYKQRRTHRTTNKSGNWSVTVSGTTTGNPGPDVEMHLKFPHLNEQSNVEHSNRSDVGVQKGYSTTFPPLSERRQRRKPESGFAFEEACAGTAEINKSREYLKNCESAIRQTSGLPARFEPRPTKTSRQRCMMNRPVHKHYHEIVTPLDTSNRHLQEIIDKLPNILAVNGNAMARQRKQSLPKMSERDLKRFLSHFSNQKIP